MVRFPKPLIFIAVNTLGFSSVGICFAIGILTEVIPISEPGFDAKAYVANLLVGTMMTWGVCFPFSFLYFFLKDWMRLVFLWAPVVCPFYYGLSVL